MFTKCAMCYQHYFRLPQSSEGLALNKTHVQTVLNKKNHPVLFKIFRLCNMHFAAKELIPLILSNFTSSFMDIFL